MNIRRIVIWIPLALLAVLVGFVAWALQYYRPTVEYAYADTRLLFIATIGLLVVTLIAWKAFRR